MPIRQSFARRPSSFIPYIKVVASRKPLLAPADAAVKRIEVEARQVRIRAAHLRRYCEICGVAAGNVLPPAYLHVLAMPLHMRLFTAAEFPAKVLGLVHLRNVIRQYQPVRADDVVGLQAEFDTLRETDIGQEYDVITRAVLGGRVIWEEVSTMLARRLVAGKRPSIERAAKDAGNVLAEATLDVPEDIGRRYGWNSGDFNPIHLTGASARLFNFKQAVAHGMWSLARCAAAAAQFLPAAPMRLDAQFKLPIYMPGEIVFRCRRAGAGADMSLSTPKGDRLHLLMQARPLA